jgi:hypothetical protein
MTVRGVGCWAVATMGVARIARVRHAAMGFKGRVKGIVWSRVDCKRVGGDALTGSGGEQQQERANAIAKAKYRDLSTALLTMRL